MDTATYPDLHAALPDITEKPEDTPYSTRRPQHASIRGTLGLALTPMVMTSLIAFNDPFLEAHDMTPLVEERHTEASSLSRVAPAASPQPMSRLSEADAANRARLVLLARQYVAGELSSEDEARLAIVSERVRRLIPRVTVQDFEVLAHILEDVHHIELADLDRRRRLGIE